MTGPDIDIAQQLADKITPIVLAKLQSQRAGIKATLSLADKLAFPFVFPLLKALVPGIILTSLREAFTVHAPVADPPRYPKGVTCPRCGLFFAANPPPGNLPTSIAYCPSCSTEVDVDWP